MAITIKQPFASAILALKKLVENRSWGKRKAGAGGLSLPNNGRNVWLALHASGTAATDSPTDAHAHHLQLLRREWPTMPPIRSLPTSAILGFFHVSEVLDAIPTDPQAVGPQCWRITAVIRLDQPLRGVAGKQGLWRTAASGLWGGGAGSSHKSCLLRGC